jgi:hypothetical protein
MACQRPWHLTGWFIHQLVCGNLPQCQKDGLNSFSTSTKQTVLLHINQQTILTPDEIANSTHIYTACRTRAWSATSPSASQPVLKSESSTPIGYKYAPASKDQTQSHLHSQQVNAKSISSSARGLPASHLATARKTHKHRARSPRNGRFKPTSLVVSRTGAQSFRK